VKLKKWISLTWTLINSHYGLSKKHYYYIEKKERVWEPLLIIFAFGMSAIGLIPLYGTLITNSFQQYSQLGAPELFLLQFMVVTGLLGFFFGIFLMIGAMLFSRDMRILIPLPLKPEEVMAAKFSTVILDQMIISLVTLLPPLIYFGIQTSAGLTFWIYGIIIFLLSQILPVTITALVVFPLARVFRFSKHRDFLIYFISSLLLVAMVIFVALVNSQGMSGDMSPARIMEMFSDPEGLLVRIGKVYPPAILASKALISKGLPGLLWFLLYILLHVVLFGALLLIGKKLYYNMYNQLQEHSAKKQEYKADELALYLQKQKNRFSALYSREWKYFLRVPSFTFNGFGNVIVFPVMIIILLSTYKTGQLSQFESYIQALKPYFIPIATLIGILSGGINGLASSIFSREGKYLPELKIVPVKSQTVLTIKLLHVSTISFIGPLIGTIAIGVILNASVLEIILAFIISALTITFLNIIQFIIDAVRPMLEWDNPQKAMKQNLNVLFSILITFGYVAGMAATGYFTRDYIQPWLMSLLLFLVSLAGSYFMWKIAVYKTRKLLSGDM